MRAERQVLFWLGAAVVLLLLTAILRQILLPFVAGIIVAYFLNPIADRLERMGIGRLAAAMLIVSFAAVIIIVALIFLVPLAATQLRQLADTLPGDLERFKGALEGWVAEMFGNRFPSVQTGLEKAFSELSQNWSAALGGLITSLWSQGLAVVNFLSLILITPVVVFYLLVDWHAMLDKIDGWLPRDHAQTIRRLANEINDAVSAFIRGQGTICLILGTFYAVALTLAGLPYGLLIGIVTGLLSFVPFVGWALGFLVSGTVALAHGWPEFGLALKVVAIFFTGVAVDSAVLSPKIVGKKIGLHPVWLIFALFVFSYLFGFVGVLVAVPVAAAVGVLVRFALEVYLGSRLYRGEGTGGGASLT